MSEQHRSYNDSYFPSSTKSTPQKTKIKQLLASLPSTPNAERPGSANYRRPPRYTPKRKQRIQSVNPSTDESFLSSPEKRDSKKMLGEIDEFLNNVKAIQKVSSQNRHIVDKPILTLQDLKVENEAEKRFSQLNLKEVTEMLSTMEEQQKFMDLRDHQIETLYDNKNFSKKQTWQCGDSKNSVPDFGFGMKDILYSEENIPLTTKPENERRDSKSSNSEQTFQTIVEKQIISQTQSKSSPCMNAPNKQASKSTKQSKGETDSSGGNYEYELSDDEKIVGKFDNMTLDVPQHFGNVSSVNLFSLAEIWNTNATQISDKEMKKLMPKLEEEKCRRKHCEKLIQELQIKILEMQQRLAVAVQVDSAKDDAILRFHEAWEKVANRWKNLESERNTISQKLLSIEQKSSTELAEASQKIIHIEIEMSKALDLAHSSQEKCNVLEKEKSEFEQKLNSVQLELKISQDSLKEVFREKHQLIEKIIHLEKQSSSDKQILLEYQNEAAKSKSVFLSCQNELSLLKDEYIKLESKINDKQNVIFNLESQKNNLQTSLEGMHKNETLLQKQIRTLQEESERAKVDLRNYYQQQVEILVKDKLKEFQGQLENAEKSLQDEMQMREQMIAKTAAKQLQKLSEKHRLEVQLVEEKHREEIRLYELQFTQMKQQIQALETKLESLQARRENIAQELHNMMEKQWIKALKIINNHNKSPQIDNPRQPQSQTIPTDSSLEVNLAHLRHLLAPKETTQTQTDPMNQFRNLLPPKESKTSGDHQDLEQKYDAKFRTKNTLTDVPFRSLPSEVFETPVSSKEGTGIQFPDFELQKYIKMLLDKLPKNTSDQPTKSVHSSQESSNSDFADVSSSWHIPTQVSMQNEIEKQAIREQRTKPPWK